MLRRGFCFLPLQLPSFGSNRRFLNSGWCRRGFLRANKRPRRMFPRRRLVGGEANGFFAPRAAQCAVESDGRQRTAEAPSRGVSRRGFGPRGLARRPSFRSRTFPDTKFAAPVVKSSGTSLLTTWSRVRIPSGPTWGPVAQRIEHVPEGPKGPEGVPGLACSPVRQSFLAVVKGSRSSQRRKAGASAQSTPPPHGGLANPAVPRQPASARSEAPRCFDCDA